MSDAVLKIGSVFDKQGIVDGMAEGVDGVQAGVVQMSTSFQEIQSVSSAAWKKISEDTLAAAGTVTDASVRVAEATQASSAAYAEQRNALKLVRTETTDSALATRILAAAQDRARQSSQALKIAQEGLSEASHHTVTDIQATSAVVRSLDGNPGIRSVERFIGTTLGLGSAMQKLFPIIGAAGLIGMFVEMGERAYEAEQKGVHAAEEIGRAFGEQTEKLHMSNDEMELQNSRLADEIAKLEKHPSNGLETALLEAVVAADKLQASLASDVKEMQELLKQHDVSLFSGILAGVVPTGGTSKEITEYSRQVEEDGQRAKLAMNERLIAASQNYKASEKAAGDNHAALKSAEDAFHTEQEAAEKAFYARMEEIGSQAKQRMLSRVNEIKAKQKEIDEHVSAAANQGAYFRAPDFSAQIKQFEGAAAGFGEIQQRATLSGTNFDLEERKGQLEGDKANKVAEKKGPNPDEEQLKEFQQEFAQEKLLHSMSIQEEYQFWEGKIAAFTKGSAQYGEVLNRLASLATEGARKFHEAIEKLKEKPGKDSEQEQAFAKEFARGQAEMQAWLQRTNEDLTRSGERWRGYWHAVAEGEQQSAKADAAFEEQSLAAKHAAGGITDLAYAEQLQQIHARTAAAEIKSLNVELKQLQDMAATAPKNPVTGKLLDPKLAEQIKQLENQIAQLQAKMKMEGATDANGVQNAFAKPFLDAFKQIDLGWQKVQRDLILGTGNIRKDFAQMGANLVVSLAQSIEKMLAQWALYELRTLLLHQLTNAQKAAADAAANTQQMATAAAAAAARRTIVVTGDVAEVLSYAAVAAAAAAAAAAPGGPPAMLAASTAAYAQVAAYAPLASFDKGGMVTQGGGYHIPILAKAGERVLSTSQTNNFERLVNNSSSSSSRTSNVRVNQRNANTFNGGKASSAAANAANIKKLHRNGKLSFR